MGRFYIKILLVVVVCFIDQNRACEEIVGQELQHFYTSNNNNYYFRRQPVTQLRTINSTILCSNVSSVTSIDYSFFEDRPYQQFLKIANSTIPTLPSLAFAKFTSITKLFLSENHIENILPGAFTGLRNLEQLYLNDNKITELSNGIYNSLHQLKILNLTNNNIQKIDKFSLMGVATLEVLFLRHNNISNVEEDFFGILKNLQHLDLSNNPLVNIYGANFTNLNEFNLSKTTLSKLSGNWSSLTIMNFDLSSSQFVEVDFAMFPITANLDLSNNKIVSVIHCELLKSSTVKLNNNQIRTLTGTFVGLLNLNLSNNDLRNLTTFFFNNTRKLQILDFSYNKITIIGTKFFRRLDTLNQLHLQHNDLVKIDTILFKDLTNLKLLNLSHNKIEDFQYGTFDSLVKLETLDISHNKLTDLHQYTFNALLNLQFLHFDNNQISSLNEVDLKNHLPRLEIVSLDKNHWQCKSLVQTYNVLKVMKVTVVPGSTFNVENFRGISCQNDKEITVLENDTQENSVEDISKNIQKSLDEAVKNSQMVRFFNKDFTNSSFFKFLNNYELSIEKRETLDEKYMEKLTSSVVQEVPETYTDKIFVCVVIVQVVVLALLLFVVCLIFKYLKQRKVQNKRRSFAEMDLF